MSDQQDSPVFDCAAVARQIGKTERWVRRHAHALPHHRYGRTYVFDAEDVAAIKELHKKRPDARDVEGQLRPINYGRRRSA